MRFALLSPMKYSVAPRTWEVKAHLNIDATFGRAIAGEFELRISHSTEDKRQLTGRSRLCMLKYRFYLEAFLNQQAAAQN